MHPIMLCIFLIARQNYGSNATMDSYGGQLHNIIHPQTTILLSWWHWNQNDHRRDNIINIMIHNHLTWMLIVSPTSCQSNERSFFFLVRATADFLTDGPTDRQFYGWYSTIEGGWRHAELCRRHSPSEWDCTITVRALLLLLYYCNYYTISIIYACVSLLLNLHICVLSLHFHSYWIKLCIYSLSFKISN